MNTTREHKVVGFQPCLLDPPLQSVAGRRRDLELNWALGFVLHHHGTSRHLVAMTEVPNFEADEVTAAQLAIDTQVEQSKLAHPTFHLKADAKCPDVLELERCFLADDLALVPWLAVNSAG